jgi:D-glycero-D-manno-heptose 1,7-bisphosphate phosphatase
LAGGFRKALFLDRDGVINTDRGYVHRIEDFQLIDGIFDLVRTARELGYAPIVVTNQSGIGRGYYTAADFEIVTKFMLERFVAEDAPIERVYHCPYHPDAVDPEYRADHPDRKPGPGMLLSAARDLDLDLAASAMIGDKASDVGAAKAAGVPRIALLNSPDADLFVDDPRVTPIASLAEAEAWLTGLAG